MDAVPHRNRLENLGGSRMIHTAPEAALILGLAHSSIRAYCTRYGVGKKIGRDWLLTEEDMAVIRSHMGQQGNRRKP